MPNFRVTSIGLNVRTSPSAVTEMNLFPPALRKGQIVEQLQISPDGNWFYVCIDGEGSQDRQGWVSANFLEPSQLPPAPPQTKPAWYSIAEREARSNIWTIAGPAANQQILEYLATTTNLSPEQQANDETPWCSAFVNWCLSEAGYVGTNNAMARSWWRWSGGERLEVPRFGCIAVFKRFVNGTDQGFGHVGFFVSRSSDELTLLGGNQGGAVNKSRYPVLSNAYELIGYIDPKPVHL